MFGQHHTSGEVIFYISLLECSDSSQRCGYLHEEECKYEDVKAECRKTCGLCGKLLECQLHQINKIFSCFIIGSKPY